MLKVYTDGASRGNPGLSGAGILITDETGKELKRTKVFLGSGTNNAAEYRALLKGLEIASGLRRKGINKSHIVFYSDSLLMVKQIKGEFKIKDSQLAKLAGEFIGRIRKRKISYSIEHIPRKRNSVADKLANEAIDEREEQLKLEF